ncbi:MAG: NUDIX domain-containing protein [Candidatus Moraniibacteriota bacterium]
MPKRNGSTFIIIKPDNTVLMQLRDENCKRFPNMWCFPGGVVDKNETPLEATVREAKEEYNLNIDKKDCTLLIKYQAPYDDNLMEYTYLCPLKGDQKPIMREGADMEWMDIDKIKSIKIGFGQDLVVNKLDNYLNEIQQTCQG